VYGWNGGVQNTFWVKVPPPSSLPPSCAIIRIRASRKYIASLWSELLYLFSVQKRAWIKTMGTDGCLLEIGLLRERFFVLETLMPYFLIFYK
jgi:hypothetical protein